MAKEFRNLFEYYGFTKRDERKYPVVSRILKSLTPERIKKEIEVVQEVRFPPRIQRLLKEYNEVSESDRKEYLWKWLYRAASMVILPTIKEQYRESLVNIKFLIFFFTGLLDDVADKYSLRDKALLDELLKIPFNTDSIKFDRLKPKEKKYILFTAKVFCYIESVIKKYPRYKEFKDIFVYDVAQLLNAIKYAYLVNENLYLINKTEYWVYLSHNMTVMLNFTIDLMCSPKFNIRDLKKLREVGWEVQRMMRIANWISTWEREIYEDDFTSAVIVYAIDSGALTINDLTKTSKKNKLEIIRKIKNSEAEKNLLREWEEDYRKTSRLELRKGIHIDLKKLSEILLLYHLSSGTTRDL